MFLPHNKAPLCLLLVALLASSHLAPPVVALESPTDISLEWSYTTFGLSIGFFGLHAVDLDGDGQLEIVADAVGPNGDYWFVLQESSGEYEIVWSSPSPLSGFDYGSLAAADLDGDGDDEVVISNGNYLQVMDGLNPEQIDFIRTNALEIKNLVIADVDSDGNPEAIFSEDFGHLYVYDLITGDLDYENSQAGYRFIAVGNVDSDPDLEIVTCSGSNGTHGVVMNGSTGVIEWQTSCFGRYFLAADVDGDGIDEIIYGDDRDSVGAINAELQSVAWAVPVSSNIEALTVGDVEGDGDLEVLYGDRAADSAIHVHDGATGAFEWLRDNFEVGMNEIEVADTDGDGIPELVWSVGASTGGADKIFVAETITGTLEWQSAEVDGPFYGLDFGDVDADGTPELLFSSVSTGQGEAPGAYFVHTGTTKNLESQASAPTDLGISTQRFLRHAQIDGDPQDEIFFTVNDGVAGVLVAYDGVTHLEERRTTLEPGRFYISLEVADVDSDGDLEILAGTWSASASTGILYVYDADSGALEWEVPGFSAETLRIANIDGDANPEIVGTSSRGYKIYDGVSRTLEVSMPDLGVITLGTGDRDGDGIDELFLSYSNGYLRQIHPFTGAQQGTIDFSSPAIVALQVIDLDGDGASDFVAANRDDVFVIDGVTANQVWIERDVGWNVGQDDSLLVGDIDGDSRLEIVVNTGGGVRVYDSGYGSQEPPEVTLFDPMDGTHYVEGDGVLFSATASDLEDGNLTDSIVWTSDLDGTLGTGGSFTLTGLSAGQHMITASVTDSAGETDSATVGIEIQSILTVGLAGHWTLDEGSGALAADSSGNGYDGTLVGGPIWTSGLLAGGLDLDGSDDGITFGATPRLDQPTAVTMAAWIQHSTTGLIHSIVDKRDGGTDGYDLFLLGSSKAFLRVNGATLESNTPVADGTWHHVVGVYDGNRLVLYVDGVEDRSSTVGAQSIDTSATLRLAQHFSSNNFRFAGTLDDVRIYDRALDAAEVDALYRHQGMPDTRVPERSNGAPSGVFPSGTTQVQISLDTSEDAICRYDTTPGTSYGSMAGLFSTTGGQSHSHTVTVSEGTAYTFYIRCRDGAGNANPNDFPISFSVQEPLDLTTGLVGHWTLDELTGTLAADSSGNGYDGTLAGGPVWTPAQVDGGLAFDGVDDGIVCAATPLLDQPATLTLAAWVKHAADGAFHSIIDKRDTGADGYDLYLSNTSKPFLRVNQHTLVGNTVVADGLWHHLVGVWNGTSLVIYVDGVLDAWKNIAATTVDTTAPLHLGEHFSVNNYRFAGTLDEVRVYDRALDAAEVQALTALGSP